MDYHGGYRQSRSICGNKHPNSPGNSTRKTYAHSRSLSSPSISPIRNQRRIHGSNILQGELRKIIPPSFDGEKKKGEDVEAWLLRMRKYF
jgi:hypothetical protein